MKGALVVTTQDIFKAATTLPDSERLQLIETLLATFDSPAGVSENTSAAWRRTASARAAEIDSGAVLPIPWDAVRKEGERRINHEPHVT